MLTYYLKVNAEVDTLAHANTIASWLTTQLSGVPTQGTPRVTFGRARDFDGNPPFVSLSVWFLDPTDAANLRDAVRDQLGTTRRAWIVRANVVFSRCFHFETTVRSCDNEFKTDWSPT